MEAKGGLASAASEDGRSGRSGSNGEGSSGDGASRLITLIDKTTTLDGADIREGVLGSGRVCDRDKSVIGAVSVTLVTEKNVGTPEHSKSSAVDMTPLC